MHDYIKHIYKFMINDWKHVTGAKKILFRQQFERNLIAMEKRNWILELK